jgi:hypothetical protein
MKFIILFLLANFSFFFVTRANAEFSCEDRHWLHTELKRLEKSCESSEYFCYAKDYAGSSIMLAIEECVRADWHRSTCARAVRCDKGKKYYTAFGYAGESLEQAIDECIKAGWVRGSCSSKIVKHQ